MKQNTQQKPINILREIETNKIAPVYLLCGEESFLIEGTLKQMIDKLLPTDTRDFNLTIMDGTVASIKEILSNVEVYPMMAKWRVVVVEEYPGFKSQKRSTSPLNLVRSAMQCETEDAQQCVTDAAKLLGISTQQIAYSGSEFHSAIAELTETLGVGLTEDLKSFFTRLPQLAAQLDIHLEQSSSDDDADMLLEWLEGDLPKSSVLIFTVKSEVSKSNRFAKAIQEVGRYASFDPLEKGSSLNNDPLYKKIVEKFATYNKKITPRAFEELRNRTGSDMHTIAEAINKIINFVGDKHQVDELDVRNLVTQTTFDRIFDLTDAIGKRSIRQALKSLREVLANGQEPVVIASTIATYLRCSLQAKLIALNKGLKPISRQMRFDYFTKNIHQPLAEELGDILPQSASHNIMKRNPFFAFKIFQSLHAFTTKDLMTALEKTFEVEIQLRTTQFDSEVLLEQLVYDICESSKHKWN